MTGLSVGVGLTSAAGTLSSQVKDLVLFLCTSFSLSNIPQTYGYKNYKRLGIIFQRGQAQDVI